MEVVRDLDLDKAKEAFDLEMYGYRIAVAEYVVKEVGGIILAPQSQESEFRTNEGVVLAIGSEVKFVSVGDTVYYGIYSGTWVERNGERFRIFNEQDLIGRVKEK